MNFEQIVSRFNHLVFQDNYKIAKLQLIRKDLKVVRGIVFCTAILLLIIGCGPEPKSSPNEVENYIKNNYDENKIVTEAFLDLNLRENKDSICLKINNLFENEIVFGGDLHTITNYGEVLPTKLKIPFRKSRSLSFEYNFQTPYGQIKTNVRLAFTLDDLLYNISILPKTDDVININAVKFLYDLYKGKYSGSEFHNNTFFISVNGTREITVSLLSKNDIVIVYKDIKLSRQNYNDKKGLEEKELKKKIKDTKDNI